MSAKRILIRRNTNLETYSVLSHLISFFSPPPFFCLSFLPKKRQIKFSRVKKYLSNNKFFHFPTSFFLYYYCCRAAHTFFPPDWLQKPLCKRQVFPSLLGGYFRRRRGKKEKCRITKFDLSTFKNALLLLSNISDILHVYGKSISPRTKSI